LTAGTRVLFEPNLERIIKAATSLDAGAPGARLSRDAHYLMLDVAAPTAAPDSRLAAAIHFPHDPDDAARLFNRRGIDNGGRLPWVLRERVNALAAALQARDSDQIARGAGIVIQLATDAALPFNTTIHRDGPPSGKFHLPPASKTSGLDMCSTTRGRIQGWLIQHRRAAIETLISEANWPCRIVKDPVEEAFAVMIDATASLDVVVAIDTELVARWNVTDVATLLAIERTFLSELEARCLPIMVSRLDAGACFAAGLLRLAAESSGVTVEAAVVKAVPEGKEPIHLIGSKNSKKFHLSTCRHAKTIKPENIVTFSSVEEAIKAGREPCAVCKPDEHDPSGPSRR